MLCPKCGYISFDHLASCGKCHADLSLVGAELRGTAVSVGEFYFLGSLLAEEGGAAPGAEPEVGGILGTPGSALMEEGEVVSLEAEEESQVVEFDLEAEEPSLAEPEQGIVLQEPEGQEISLADEAEMVLSDELSAPDEEIVLDEAGAEVPSKDREEAGPPPEEAALSLPSEGLDFDATSLTLDGLEVEGLREGGDAAQAEAVPAAAESLAIDLSAIATDMSDLMATGTTPPPTDASADTDVLEFDETIDLSLYGEHGGDASSEAGDDDIQPIDITLEGDTLLNLAVETTRESTKKEQRTSKSKTEAEIPELTMED